MLRTYLLCSLLFASSIYAEPDFVLEYFPNSEIPQIYAEICSKYGDLTVVNIINWPANEIINFEAHRLNEEITRNSIYSSDKGEGTLVVPSAGYIPGEPIIYRLISADSNIDSAIKIFPNPIYETKPDGSCVEVEVTSLFPYIANIVIKNFEVGEEFTFRSLSGGEKFEHTHKFEGVKNIMYSPEVIGLKGGIAEIEIERKNGDIFKLSIPWGLEVFNYRMYFDENKEHKKLIDCEFFLKRNPMIADYFKQKNTYPSDIQVKFYLKKNIPSAYMSSIAVRVGANLSVVELNKWPPHATIIAKTQRLTDMSPMREVLSATKEGISKHLFTTLIYFPGEPVFGEYSTNDGAIKRNIKFIPNPLGDFKKDGSALEIEMISLFAKNKIHLKGFEQGESFIYRTITRGKKEEVEMTFDKDRELFFDSSNIGLGGITDIEVQRKSGELYKVSLPWGFELLKYASIVDKDKKIITLIDSIEMRELAERYFEYQKNLNLNKETYENI